MSGATTNYHFDKDAAMKVSQMFHGDGSLSISIEAAGEYGGVTVFVTETQAEAILAQFHAILNPAPVPVPHSLATASAIVEDAIR